MNINTKIIYKGGDPAILRAIEILRRDMAFVFLPTNEDGGEIRLNLVDIAPEGFRIEGGDIFAGDALGFVYALMRISENSLGIPPFWFWYDHKHKKIPAAEIADFISKPAKIRYRGWFINDEILLNKWSPDSDPMSPWHMAYEALLRCGGNMIIPNTQVSRPHCDLAAQYGLWLTHHHAEPLGAEMFVKIYPDLPPSYFLHEDKFKALWLDGINWQKGHNVIWNLGFRGQGDQAFWSSDTRGDFATDEARGGLISRLIRYQYDLVREHIPDGICCTYIYGEIMGLYRDGHISIPDDVIKIWADNGYGKMVVRRTGRENTRQAALPDSPGRHGIYYHVSFVDLQASAHMTQIPNSNDFLQNELTAAFERGADDYLIVNCSNIRPHVFPLAMIAALWRGEDFDPAKFGEIYFGCAAAADAFGDYANAAVNYGQHNDEHAGDQFYNYNTRNLISNIMKSNDTCPELFWATGEAPIAAQLKWFADKCEMGEKQYAEFLARHNTDFDDLHKSTIILHARLHYHGYRGGALFAEAAAAFFAADYKTAFYQAGLARDEFALANAAMHDAEYGIWRGFYANDCFADYKFTAHLLEVLMAYIRNFGDGPGYHEWQRELFYPPSEKGIRLQLNIENRQTAGEMFDKIKSESCFPGQTML